MPSEDGTRQCGVRALASHFHRSEIAGAGGVRSWKYHVRTGIMRCQMGASISTRTRARKRLPVVLYATAAAYVVALVFLASLQGDGSVHGAAAYIAIYGIYTVPAYTGTWAAVAYQRGGINVARCAGWVNLAIWWLWTVFWMTFLLAGVVYLPGAILCTIGLISARRTPLRGA
jgi:hypothetical protein